MRMLQMSRATTWSPPPVPEPMRKGAIASIAPGEADSDNEDEDKSACGERIAWRALMGGPMIRQVLPPKPTFARQDERAIHAAWDTAQAQRTQHLQNIAAAPSAPLHTPKDLSVLPRYMYLRCTTQEGATYCAQFTRIGMLEGFRTVVEGYAWEQFNIARTLRTCMARITTYTDDDDAEWAEDDGSMACDGSISVPASIDDSQFIRDSLVQGRLTRIAGQPINFTYSGNVDTEDRQRFKVALAVRMQRPLRVNFSHVEGGNILIGVRPSGVPYAIVGRDSVELSRRLIARDRDRRCSLDEALVAIGKDYGIDPKEVWPVEQPRTFHLDMAMVLMAPGQVLLQDSMAAARLEITWRAQDAVKEEPNVLGINASDDERQRHARAVSLWKLKRTGKDSYAHELKRRARLFTPFEDRSLRDLRAAGLEVHLVAGRFSSALRSVNFFNGEGGRNKHGEAYFATQSQSGDLRAQAHIADTYLRQIPTGLTRVYFIDADASAESLLGWGGAACRAKAEGDVFWPQPRRFAWALSD